MFHAGDVKCVCGCFGCVFKVWCGKRRQVWYVAKVRNVRVWYFTCVALPGICAGTYEVLKGTGVSEETLGHGRFPMISYNYRKTNSGQMIQWIPIRINVRGIKM